MTDPEKPQYPVQVMAGIAITWAGSQGDRK